MTSLLFVSCLLLQLSATNDDDFFHLDLWTVSSRNAALAFTEDHTGLMWIATFDGLHYYDGHQLHSYSSPASASTGLDSANIMTLARDPVEGIWIGSSAGLFHLHPQRGTLKHYQTSEADPPTQAGEGQPVSFLPDGTVWHLFFDSRQRLWVGFEGGLARFDPETQTFTLYQANPQRPDGLLHHTVYALAEDKEGFLWVGTGETLQRFDADQEQFDNSLHTSGLDQGMIAGGVFSLVVDQADRIWMALAPTHDNRVRSRLARLSSDRLKLDVVPVPIQSGTETLQVRTLEPDGEGGIWVGLSDIFGGGLYRLNPETTEIRPIHPHRRDTPSLQAHSLTKLYRSDQGRLWVGTLDRGLYVVDPHRAHFHPVQTSDIPGQPLHGRHIWGMAEEPDGRLWLTCAFTGLERWDPTTNRSQSFADLPILPANTAPQANPRLFTDIQHDEAGALYVVVWRTGLLRLQPDQQAFELVFPKEQPVHHTDRFLRAVRRDESGSFWLVTGHHLIRFNPRDDTTRHFPYPFPLKNAPFNIRGVSNIRNRTLYIATQDHALYRFNTQAETFEPSHNQNLNKRQINALWLTDDDRLWVGTNTGPVLYDPRQQQLSPITVGGDLSSSPIWSIGEDGQGALWLHGPRGLWHLQSDLSRTRLFHLPSNFQARMNGNSTFYQSKTRTFYLGGHPGFVYFDAAVLKLPSQPAPVLLTGLETAFPEQQFDDPLGFFTSDVAQEGLILPYGQTNVSFQFAARDTRGNSQPRFTTYLENHDDSWRPADTGTVASYSQLPPGDYVFQVKALNTDGLWSDPPLKLPVTVLPPWWHTPTARILFALTAMALLAAADHWRSCHVLAKTKEAHAQREAESALQAAQLEAKAVAAEAEALRQENERKNLELAKTRELEAVNQNLARQAEALQQERETTERQAQQLLEQDELKSRFFANISHELRTPLALILPTLVDIKGQRHGTVPATYLRLTQAAHQQGQRLLRLINQLLDLSKLEARHMPLRAQRGDLNHFLQHMVTLFEAMSEPSGVDLQYRGTETPFPAVFEPEKLEKVLSNLLANAFKFTDKGGKILVTLARRERNNQSWAVIDVKDTGIGISSDEQPRVFDRFYQVGREKRDSHGTGLGLALVRELTELHHGTVDLQSEPGFGTTFTLNLPLDEAAFGADEIIEDGEVRAATPVGNLPVLTDDAPPAPPPMKPTPEHLPLILIAEDHAGFRGYLSETLAGRFRILAYPTGEQALAAAKSSTPDLVLSDVMMPDMDGFELCRALKSDPETAHLPVVLLTAKASDQSKRDGLALGADDYLAKPVEIEELILRIDGLIKTRHSMRDRYSKEMVLGPKRIVADSADAQWLQKLRDVIETHLEDPEFSVAGLAEEVGLSRRQLQRKLNDVTGLSPSAFLRTMRLQRAADLLRQHAGTVAEIAYQTGFKNPDHFSRVFSSEFGTAPSKFAETDAAETGDATDTTSETQTADQVPGSGRITANTSG